MVVLLLTSLTGVSWFLTSLGGAGLVLCSGLITAFNTFLPEWNAATNNTNSTTPIKPTFQSDQSNVLVPLKSRTRWTFVTRRLRCSSEQHGCVCVSAMPCLTLVHTKGQGVTGRADARDGGSKWVRAGEPAEQNQDQLSFSLNQTSAEVQAKQNLWPQTQRTFGHRSSLTSAAVVCLVFLLEALLHPSLSPEALCCRLFLLGSLWVLLGGCVYTLKHCLKPELNQVEPPRREQQVVLMENSRNLFSLISWPRMSQTRSPEVPLSAALTDSLLLCVLQELLQEPSVAHIQALLSKLEVVAQTLETAGPEPVLAEVDRGSALADKLKLLCTYLQQRTGLLRGLVQVQGDFETSVRDQLWGLQELWIQLEDLHTGVTLTKQEGQGHRDLTSVQTDTEALVAELGRYRNKLQSCEAHLKASTELLQELTWSHAHISSKLNIGCSESVWPELLLQSNMEKFDEVQEIFTPLEQQAHTFQTHLEGLGGGDQQVGPLVRADRACVSSASPQTSSLKSSTRTTPLSALKISTFKQRLKPGKKP